MSLLTRLMARLEQLDGPDVVFMLAATLFLGSMLLIGGWVFVYQMARLWKGCP